MHGEMFIMPERGPFSFKRNKRRVEPSTTQTESYLTNQEDIQLNNLNFRKKNFKVTDFITRFQQGIITTSEIELFKEIFLSTEDNGIELIEEVEKILINTKKPKDVLNLSELVDILGSVNQTDLELIVYLIQKTRIPTIEELRDMVSIAKKRESDLVNIPYAHKDSKQKKVGRLASNIQQLAIICGYSLSELLYIDYDNENLLKGLSAKEYTLLNVLIHPLQNDQLIDLNITFDQAQKLRVLLVNHPRFFGEYIEVIEKNINKLFPLIDTVGNILFSQANDGESFAIDQSHEQKKYHIRLLSMMYKLLLKDLKSNNDPSYELHIKDLGDFSKITERLSTYAKYNSIYISELATRAQSRINHEFIDEQLKRERRGVREIYDVSVQDLLQGFFSKIDSGLKEAMQLLNKSLR